MPTAFRPLERVVLRPSNCVMMAEQGHIALSLALNHRFSATSRGYSFDAGKSRPFVRGASAMPMPTKSYPFQARHRLSGKIAFSAVYAAGAKQSRHPLVAYSKLNNLSHCRWGLSVSRRVGTAPRRNRVKRLLRESIRLLQPDLPKGYDIILVVRPHDPLPLAEYQKILIALVLKSRDHWAKTAK
jgi:ribonuclease P protein component